MKLNSNGNDILRMVSQYEEYSVLNWNNKSNSFDNSQNPLLLITVPLITHYRSGLGRNNSS